MTRVRYESLTSTTIHDHPGITNDKLDIVHFPYQSQTMNQLIDSKSPVGRCSTMKLNRSLLSPSKVL